MPKRGYKHLGQGGRRYGGNDPQRRKPPELDWRTKWKQYKEATEKEMTPQEIWMQNFYGDHTDRTASHLLIAEDSREAKSEEP
jgi:hypothetical protein